MRKSVSKTYFFIPVLYVSIIVLMIHLGINNKNNFFNITNGPITVKGRGQEGLDKNSLKDLNVLIGGIKLNLYEKPAILIDSNGSKSRITPTGFTFQDKKLIVSYSNSVRLEFKYGNSKKEDVNAVFSVSNKSVNYSRIILTVKDGLSMKKLDSLPGYTFNDQGTKKLWIFEHGSNFDPKEGIISLSLHGNKSAFSISETKGNNAFSFFFFKDQKPAEENNYESLTEKYININYDFWKTHDFDNDTVAAFAAESLKRGRYSAVRELTRRIESHKDDLNYISAPFAGNIVETDKKRSLNNDLLVKKITSSETDESVFTIPHLIDEIRWIASPALYDAFNNLVLSLDTSKSYSEKVLIGMIESYRDVINGNSIHFPGVLKLRPLIDTQLYPLLFHAGQGLFIQNSKGLADTELSMRAGTALYDIGQTENNILMTSLGRTLVVSCLKLMDKEGSIPSYLTRNGEEIPGKRYRKAELLYPALSNSGYYPHVVTFNEGTSSEIQVWTCSNDISLHRTKGSLIFDISFPVKIGHHLVLKNIPEFKTLTLRGIPWNSDRRFQYYTSGWVYDKKLKVLYLKLTQKKNKEQIILTF